MSPRHQIAFYALCAVAGGLVMIAWTLIEARVEARTSPTTLTPVRMPTPPAPAPIPAIPVGLEAPAVAREEMWTAAEATAERLCALHATEVKSQLPPHRTLFGHRQSPEARPADLVPAPAGFNMSNCGQIHVSMRDDLDRLLRAARADPAVGDAIVGLSCFRSIDRQAALFCNPARLEQRGIVEQARWVAPPGYSEHATGRTIDFGSRSGACNLKTCFDADPVGRWLKENASRFGFRLSFPKGNPQGVGYEPWHYTYVGAE